MDNNTYILGISCFYHDSAAALIKDGRLIAAAQEERFTRKKHDDSFPENAVRYCLEDAGIKISDLRAIVFYDKPLLKFERILITHIKVWPKSFLSFLKAVPVWLKKKLWVKNIIRKELGFNGEIYFSDHHLSHAASAFFCSPFEDSAVLTIDAVGEWATTTYGVGRGNKINLTHEINFPDSLGLFYSAITYYLGFKVNSAEYKVMGLAPYGRPLYTDLMRKLIDIKDDGSFRLNQKYFNYEYGLKMSGRNLEKLFGMETRKKESELTQKHKDIAASLQSVTEDIILKMANHIQKETKMENLCLAGGVALNCVANGRIVRETDFKKVFIQPAAGDAGAAAGAAMYLYYAAMDNPRNYAMEHAFLGPEFGDEKIKSLLVSRKIPYKFLNNDELAKEVAGLISGNNVIGWFQGRMEFGPRALGNRSIIADARNKDNWQKVNLKIKFRESFRPFAPTVLEEKCAEYFDLNQPSPYMLLTAQVKKLDIPAVTHIDGSARVQTVNKEQNMLYYELLKEFYKKTGCPAVINTSFNVRGEPIVLSPEDAFLCFMRTQMDYLVLGGYLLDKKQMPKLKEEKNWQKEFEID